MDVFSACHKRENILNEHRKKEFIRIYRKTFNALYKLQLKSLEVEVSFFNRAEDMSFNITVFTVGPDCENTSFTGYDWKDPEQLEAQADEVISAIKKEDFDLFRVVSDWQYKGDVKSVRAD